MAVHVAILQPAYLDLVLVGQKTVESRLSRTSLAPFGRIQPGQRIYFKNSGGPFRALAQADWVHQEQDLTPHRVDQLRQRHNPRVHGDPDYWERKRHSRFATFVGLTAVEPIDLGPDYRKSPYRAWFVLPPEADPLYDFTLTPGALRNAYVLTPTRFPAGPVVLELPDGHRVETRRLPNGRIQWRGWGRYYQQQRLQPGDRVRLLQTAPQRFRVRWVHAEEKDLVP